MTAPFRVSADPDAAQISIDPRRWPPTREGVRALEHHLRTAVQGLGAKLDPGAPMFSVRTRCGRLYEFDTADDFPLSDLPCGCGHPDCVVVEWREGDDA